MYSSRNASIINRTTLNVTAAFILITCSCTIGACNSEDEHARISVNELDSYVKAHRDSVDYFLDREWAGIDSEYNYRVGDIHKHHANISSEMSRRMEENRMAWDSFRNDYTLKRSDREALREKAAAVEVSVLERNLSNINEENVADAYEHFAGAVDVSKATYTKEDWKSIDEQWEKLNDMRDKCADKITPRDRLRIQKAKSKYVRFKMLHMPFAKKSQEDH